MIMRKPGPREPEPGPGEWTLSTYETADGLVPFDAFVDDLDLYEQRLLHVCLQEVLAKQGHNVCGSQWGKNLTGGLYEFRVGQSMASVCGTAGIPVPDSYADKADRRPLLRVFFTVYGDRVVLLLGGYDKGADPSTKRQGKEIKRARKLLTAARAELDRGHR